MARCMGLIGFFIVALALLEGATAVDYEVGGSLGWAVPSNGDYYNDWASNKTFVIGDRLVFNWTGSHTAADVAKEDYDNCSKSNGIILGSPVAVTLDSNGTRYFVCTIDSHCERGQKMKIVIGDGTTNSTTPSSAATSLLVGAFPAFLSTIVISFLSYCT